MEFVTNLDNYNIFYEVAKCKNITKASERLFISQPAVSQAIKKLEENLQVSLFVRSKKGMELTSIGMKIFEMVEIALKKLSEVEHLIDEEKGLLTGELVFGAGSSITREVLCEPIAAFSLDYPLVEIKIIEEVQSKMTQMLANGKLNFMLTQHNENIDFPFVPLFQTDYCFVKSAKCEIDKFILITEGSYANLLFKKFIEEYGVDNAKQMEVAGYKTAIKLSELDAGIALVPRYMVETQLKEGLLIEMFEDYELPKISFGIYYNPQILTPASKVFLEYVK